METTWNYTDMREYRSKIAEGMPPLIISCAVTGGYQKHENPNVPVSAEEQAQAAADVCAAGACIIHIHARQADDPTQESTDPARLREINAQMRAKAPEIIIDNTQTCTELSVGPDELVGKALRFKSAPLDANPEIMALNPGPMTFRGKSGSPSSVIVTTFDDTERAANTLRERNIKPQVFLYHPGHLDILEDLITHDALDKPYFVQVVFGQQSGISTSPENVLSMVRNLPEGCIFQTCALGLEAGASQRALDTARRTRPYRHGGLRDVSARRAGARKRPARRADRSHSERPGTSSRERRRSSSDAGLGPSDAVLGSYNSRLEHHASHGFRTVREQAMWRTHSCVPYRHSWRRDPTNFRQLRPTRDQTN